MSLESFLGEKEIALDQDPERGRACFFPLLELVDELGTLGATKKEARATLDKY